MNLKLKNEYFEVLEKLNLKETYNILLVSIKQQRMYHQKEGKTVKTYVISSSSNPPSCIEDSLGTPLGLHEVCQVIGLDQPKGMVFKGRVPMNLCYWQCNEDLRKKNLITSRILRLQGLEDGLNLGKGRDSYDRFVYVHGTNHEDKLGRPASSGCIQLANNDVIELAEQIPDGSHLYISLK